MLRSEMPVAVKSPPGPAQVFSHPELNSLRFLAFLLVFLDHAQPVRWFAGGYSRAGAFGVPVFFLLSAYLIVSLLLRERAATGTVNIRYFAIRRMLRIWPLYFTALVAGFVIGHLDPGVYMPRGMLAAFTLLAGNLYVARHGWTLSPCSILWSLSVEEQFYLLIPALAKFAGRRGIQISCWLTLLSAYALLLHFGLHPVKDDDAVWVNSLVCFQFFAAGGLLATSPRCAVHRPGLPLRAVLLTSGLLLFVIGAGHGRLIEKLPYFLRLGTVYGLGLFGSLLIFLAFLNYPARQRSWPAYLGVISYGLYVFHPWCLELFVDLFGSVLDVGPHKGAIADVLAFGLTIALAALSYRFFERPILKTKARFEIVRSRPA